MIKLVINADDYGIAENQTEAILHCFRQGLITSTTIMVTMPDFRRAAVRAKEECVFDKIGLHFNLTEGTPLTERIRKSPRFCAPDGSFNKFFHRSKWCRFFLSREEQHAVAEEAEAQMQKYCDAGFPLMHLDSHHHSHTDPAIARVVLPIAKRFGFRSVRISRNITRVGYGVVKKVYKYFVNGIIHKYNFVCTDFFGSVMDLDSAGSRLPRDCTVELMVHPSLQTAGHLDIAGTLMDMCTPMSSITEMLARHRTRYALVDYGSIREGWDV